MINEFLLTNTLVVTEDKITKGTIWVKDGLIYKILDDTCTLPSIDTIDAKDTYAIPGFIDTHIHGSFGYGPETGNPQDLLDLSLALARQGVTAFCPTLYCGSICYLENLLTNLSTVIGQEKGAKIIGFHLEGPFISPKKPGVMKPQDIESVNLENFERLFNAANQKILAVTLAPELENCEQIITFCKQHNIVVQMGHTNASYADFVKAVNLGVTHITHLFNAMSPLHHRDLGVVGGALTHPEVSCEIIADGVHVHPNLIKLLKQVKPIKNIVLVTDALRPTGLTCPPFVANNEEVVLQDNVWKRKKDNVIAGSCLTMLGGIKNLLTWGYSLQEIAQISSTNPARIFGLNDMGKIEIGTKANIVLLDKDYSLKSTYINGKLC